MGILMLYRSIRESPLPFSLNLLKLSLFIQFITRYQHDHSPFFLLLPLLSLSPTLKSTLPKLSVLLDLLGRTYDCSNTGNVSRNGAYRKNVDTLVSSLTSNTQIDFGFYNFSVGENSDRVNAVALCREDLTPTNCRSLNLCNLLGVVNVTDRSGTFDQVLETLLDRLRSEAAASTSTLRKFATGSASSPHFDIYALLQCTPDLNQQECSDCLNQSIAEIPTCCGSALGVRVLTPSCNLSSWMGSCGCMSSLNPKMKRRKLETTMVGSVRLIIKIGHRRGACLRLYLLCLSLARMCPYSYLLAEKTDFEF
ncbi:hypothetical protein I3760_10G134600 [Carya illinoinensis]|nr:hypothetical protein I3760_10G134600 [Carya illinoinensis]